jgi:YegS/Rv2252/BmrU family lipid kinase
MATDARPFLIVNPASANGQTGRHFDRIARAVAHALGDFRCVFTRRRGEASDLAREAVADGERLVVAVGGDGTASEVIDGLVHEGRPRAPELVFGCIPRGTGGDLRRSLGWPEDPGEAARTIAAGTLAVCDLGIVEFVGHDGRAQRRHFANVSSCGVSGMVVEEVARSSKRLGGKASFMLASAKALWRYHDQPLRWRIDGGPWREEAVTALCVCNGRYFGGGMMVAPDASLDDGLFDVTCWKGLGFKDFILKKHMLYDGTHVRLPNTRRARARVVEAEPLSGARVLLDVDGEQPGVLPARWTIAPRALTLRAPLVGAGRG